MGKLICAATSWMLLTVGAVEAQTAQTQISENLLPQWLTGIIAVSAFLFLSFVGLLVKKAWCEESSRRKTSVESLRENDRVMTESPYETTLDMVRSKEDTNTYDNPATGSTDDRVTSL